MFTAPRPTNEAEAIYVAAMAYKYLEGAQDAQAKEVPFFGLTGKDLAESIQSALNHADRAQCIVDGYEDLRNPSISQDEWERMMWEEEEAEWAALEAAQAVLG